MAVRFSTAEVVRRSQLDYWREVVCATFFALDVERGGPSRTGFRGEITAQSLDRLRIATVSSEPHAVIRSAARIRQSHDDDFVVNLAVPSAQPQAPGIPGAGPGRWPARPP